MKSSRSAFPFLFSLVMLICVLFIAWYLPSVGERRFLLQDVQKSLETSVGRERKQQHEYDQTVAALSAVNSELERLLPLAEDAKAEVKTLKEERNRLRDEKKLLESQQIDAAEQEAESHE